MVIGEEKDVQYRHNECMKYLISRA